ncbi:uncharacterized protein EMH_0044460 [Eimeria mitis]|uniref:Transmembrane protein n=1 Tax=Eimeria mitis TaxID=44415 RepID=U6K460_9EIME|nr:uncharacterized protein EMH_0044460 [Eimeria mitis]CDJ32510.1 hypothetical protein, conserved [Eimeria mitis]
MLLTGVLDMPGDEQQGGALKLSPPQLENEFIVEEAISQVGIPPPIQVPGSPVVHQSQLRWFPKARSRKQSLLLYLTAAIPLFAFLVIWSVCTAAYNRERAPGAVRRRLAAGGEGADEVEDSILEGCLALEEDLGIPQTGTPSSSGDRYSRIAQLVSTFSEVAATHQSIHGTYTTISEAPSRLNPLGQAQLQPLETPLRERGLLEQEEGAAYAGWLPLPTHGDDCGGTIPALHPDAWLEGIPDILAAHETQEQGEASWEAGGGDAGSEAPSTEAAAVQLPHGEDTRTNEAAVQLPHGEDTRTNEDEGIKNHPFVRLPVLEEGVVPRDFDETVAFPGHRRKFRQLNAIFKSLRVMFLQPTLNQDEANYLVNGLEDLVYSLMLRLRLRSAYANFALDLPTLGKYFLAFDFLVSGMHVLRESMHTDKWWDRFASGFVLEIRMPRLSRNSRHCSTVQRALVGRLLDAMRIYLKGIRPPLMEVLRLKRLLLCSPYTHRRFKEHHFDAWRDDEAVS